LTKTGWATFWAIFSQTHQVTLRRTHGETSLNEKKCVLVAPKRKKKKKLCHVFHPV
jgi:hypothetical protein